MKKADLNEILYHIGFSTQMIEKAEHAILLDNSEYVQLLAKALDKNAKFIADNREYLSYLVEVSGKKVVVVSTGFGAPPMGIGLEEMAMVGIKNFIRLGEAGAIQYGLNIGDQLIIKGAIRKEGTSQHYAPLNYPAAASLTLTQVIRKAFEEAEIQAKPGIAVSLDMLWPVENTTEHIFDYLNEDLYHELLKKWRKQNVQCMDNAVSAMFTICNVFGLKSAAILDIVMRNFEDSSVRGGIHSNPQERVEKWAKVLKIVYREYESQ